MKPRLLSLVSAHLLLAYAPSSKAMHGFERMFYNIQAPPYQINEDYTLDFHFKSNIKEPAIIEIYLTNQTFNQVNVYTRSVPETYQFTGTLELLPFMLDGSNIDLWFKARSPILQIEQLLTIFPKQVVVISEFINEEIVIVNENYAYLDEQGLFKKESEQIILTGFFDMLVSPYYLYLSLDSLAISFNSPKQQAFNIQQLLFQIGDHDNSFPLLGFNTGTGTIFLPLDIRQHNQTYHFTFPDMYVDPITYLISSNPINQFIKTNKLYLPKNKFEQLKQIPILLTIKISALNDYHILYNPTYVSERAMFSNCITGYYCIKTHKDTIPDGAIKQVVTLNG